jgi:uncharacterized membrane protein
MTYNIHPLFVHFPIALLFIYSIIKILPLKKVFPSVSWKHIERTLLFLGVLGAFAALSTGDIAEHLVHPNRDLVEAHSFFAAMATWTYAILLIGEILSVCMSWVTLKLKSAAVIKVITLFKNLLTNPALSILLAVIGLISISVTGLLGGVMVYSVSADPIAGIVLKLLGITL